MSPVLGAVVTAVVVSAVLALLVPWLRRRGVLDIPGSRSSHEVPTPRGGGLAVMVGVSVGYVVAGGDSAIVIGLGVAAGLIGLADDISGLSARVRLAGQVVIVGVAVPFLLADLTWAWYWQVAFGAVVFLGAVGFINAFNFMDGINGISGVQLLIAGGAWCVVGVVEDLDSVTVAGAVTAAAAVAFLPWNFPRARVFLGDVGSYFSGAWLSAVAVVATVHGAPVEAMAAPLLVYVADTVTTLLRRRVQGESLTSAHRDHTYQRLLLDGWDHARVTGIAGLFMVLASVGGI
ncbi:MAG: glycosyltransferase family 4 protein, partial [Acidimicrobiia bacterium]|nr:glycosyltransferase family 4 protein [Acidimicrobiia bacterium]